jgi:hypothetical protein
MLDTTSVLQKDGTITLNGIFYSGFLDLLHRTLKPKNYFEIGTLSGETLKLATCKSISVDPKFVISSNVTGLKEALFLFQMTSDDFFRYQSPSRLFDEPIELAFLDGMHMFEFLLRDVMNTERHCKPNSIICLHDCLPPHPLNALREQGDGRRKAALNPDWWTGDVWKIVPVLRKFRPDLQLHVLDCPPTGLIVITNLNPNSSILRENYATIVKEYVNINLDEYDFNKFIKECDIQDSSRYNSFERLHKYFWL